MLKMLIHTLQIHRGVSTFTFKLGGTFKLPLWCRVLQILSIKVIYKQKQPNMHPL